MNLALDFGNTRVKAGLFSKGHLQNTFVFDGPADLLKSDIFDKATRCIICSVTNFHVPVMEKIPAATQTLLFRPDTPVPLKNLYRSALTLGSDRLAAAVGSYLLYPGRNVLTIDAGTCIKYNFVNSDNEYLGGAISPGVPMRLKAMNHYTKRLPLIEADAAFDKLTGTNTSESLLCGAITGAACEVEAMAGRYSRAYQDLQVVITGGDASYLSRQLKNSFFAHQDLVLLGLHTILQFNLEK